MIGATEWTWFDSGGDLPGLMLLEGGLGSGDSYVPFFEPLYAHARILIPRLPPELYRIAPAVDGLVGILDSLRIARVHLLGPSRGGYSESGASPPTISARGSLRPPSCNATISATSSSKPKISPHGLADP